MNIRKHELYGTDIVSRILSLIQIVQTPYPYVRYCRMIMTIKLGFGETPEMVEI